MQRKYAEDDQEALKELARRHMLQRATEDERVRGRLRGKQPEGGLMELLVQSAKRGQVPQNRRMDMRQLERKYQGVDDQRLLARAREGGLGQRGSRMMRRLIERKDDNPSTHQTTQEGTRPTG